VVVEAEVKEEQGRPLIGVNGVVCSKKDLTGPTLLEMYEYGVNQDLGWIYQARGGRKLRKP
jgi:hypothetical protein